MSRSSNTGRPARPPESALVVLVPEAEPLVSALRARFDPSAARGMPAHITLLYPFHSADRLSASRVSELAAFFSGWRRFCFSLVGICGFEGVVVLAPEPLDPFDALTQALAARYPDTPPYGGVIADPIPHLTVARTPTATSIDDVASEVFAVMSPQLPLACEVREVALALERSDRWSIGARFPLAS